MVYVMAVLVLLLTIAASVLLVRSGFERLAGNVSIANEQAQLGYKFGLASLVVGVILVILPQ